MDNLINEIIEIFNLEGVTLVRLSGLFRHLYDIDTNILPEQIHLIIYKLNENNIINYKICCFCPHCHEIFYLKNDEKNHKCDTCQVSFDINQLNIIHEKDISNLIEIFKQNI